MKEIKLSQQGKNKILNLVALVDDEDFEYLNQWKWHATKGKGKRIYYATRTLNNGKGIICMHRIILNLTNPKIFTDHIDRNGLNNQKSNLRPCTQSQNEANKLSHKDSLSKYKGICWNNAKNKWVARICKNGINTNLGYFNNEIDAALAYNNAARKVHGEFARVNEF